MEISDIWASIFETIQFKLIVAFIVGSIIGLERQFTKTRETESDIPGVRTFGLISLLGAAATIIEFEFGIPYVIIVSFLAVLLWTMLFLLYDIFVRKEIYETTAIAVFLAYVLGIFVGIGMFYWAIILSVFITAILSSKHVVKGILASLEYKEITSALTIGLLALVILPIIPPVRILGILDLQLYFIFLIFILMIQFSGYMIIKYLGMRKGFVMFASIGALVHSEATTVEVTRIYNKFKSKISVAFTTTAIIAIIMTLILRTLLYLIVLAFMMPTIIYLYAIVVAPSIMIGTIYLFFRLRRYNIPTEGKIEIIKNPLSYREATKFSLILFIVSIALILIETLSPQYSLLVAFASGFYSVSGVELAVISLLLAEKISTETGLLLLIAALTAGIINKVIYVKYGGGDRNLIIRVLIHIISFVVVLFASYLITLNFLTI